MQMIIINLECIYIVSYTVFYNEYIFQANIEDLLLFKMYISFWVVFKEEKLELDFEMDSINCHLSFNNCYIYDKWIKTYAHIQPPEYDILRTYEVFYIYLINFLIDVQKCEI